MASAPQGYIILALGPPRYISMAANLAASIKVMDGTRPVCLIHDAEADISPEIAVLFDHRVPLEPDTRYPHVMNKLRLFDISPYEFTMFVDSDCLLVKGDVDRYWAMAATRPFSITGSKATSGEWKGVDIAAVLRQERAPYLVRMNAGVFCFDKSPASRNFFSGLNEFYLGRRDHLNISFYHGQRTQTDELYMGIFMGLSGMDCANMDGNDKNSWMVSTWRSLYCSFDPQSERSVIYKGDNHRFGMPFLPGNVTRLSPTFAHFIGLKPRRLYRRLSAKFHSLEQAKNRLSHSVPMPAPAP